MATSLPEIKTKKPKKGGRLCAAINCHNHHCNSRVSLFRFPKDKERSKQWVINIRRADLESYTAEHLYKFYNVCANHFEDSQFMNPAKRNSLIHNAVPTIFDVPNPPPLLTPRRPIPKRHETVQTATTLSPEEPLITIEEHPKKGTQPKIILKKFLLLITIKSIFYNYQGTDFHSC